MRAISILREGMLLSLLRLCLGRCGWMIGRVHEFLELLGDPGSGPAARACATRAPDDASSIERAIGGSRSQLGIATSGRRRAPVLAQKQDRDPLFPQQQRAFTVRVALILNQRQ